MAEKKRRKKITTKSKKAMRGLVVQEKIPRKRVEPDDWYEAKLTNAEVKESTFGKGDYLQLDFEFTETEDNVDEGGDSAKGLMISGIFGLPMRVDNKAYKAITAIVGSELQVEDEVDLPAFYGHTFMIFIEDKDSTDDDGLAWQKISKIRKPRRKKKTKTKTGTAKKTSKKTTSK